MPKCTEQNLQSVKETPQCTKETPQQMLVMPPQDVEMPKNIEETSQCVEEMSQNIAETSPCVEEMRQIIEETSKNVEEILQNIEEVPQNIEETSQYVEELAPCVQERHPVDQRTDNNSSAEINISSNEINHEKITYSESSTLMDEDIVKNSESVTVKNTAKVNECETFSNSKANEIEETCSQSIQCEMQTTISAAGPNSNIVMNNVLNDLTNNNVKENKSNLVDAGIQTEPLVCVYDTPPSEQQFDAKSPDCLLPSTNKYFEKSTMNYEINTLVARSITEDEQLNFDGASSADSEPTDMEALKDQTALSIEMDEHTHIDRNISESDKENSYDLENAENSDFDIEEYDVQLHTSIDITNEHIDEESQDDSILQTESQPIKVVIGKVMSIPEAEFESHRDVEFLNNEEDKHGNDTYVESEENPEDDEQRSSDHTEAFKSVTQDLNDHSFSTLQDYNSSSNLEASHSSSESSPEIESETITNLDGNVQIENNLLNNFKSVLNNNCNTLIEKDNENENNRVTKNKIMYSSSQTITTCESFESFYKDNLINNVSETFKEAFSGPLSKLNGTTLMANGNFDLFDGLQKQPLTAELGIKTKIPEGISPKANSNTETNSSEASSPNDTSPLYQNLDKVDIESHFMNMQFDDEMRNFFKVGESKPKTKRVAISEEKNIFYKDHRTAEDMENIYGKRRKIHPVRSKRNEPEIKYNDEKLQKQPIVRLEYFTEAQLWKKYQEELAMAMLERAMSARKHNTTKSCIVLRYNYKKGQENNEDMMPQQNYVFEGTVANSSISLPNDFNNLNLDDNSKPERVLNLTIPSQDSNVLEEFSNSPKFLQDCDQIIENCLNEKSFEETPTATKSDNLDFLSNNSNFYQCSNINSVDTSQSKTSNNSNSLPSLDNCNETNASEESEEIDILNLSNESELLNSLLKSLNSENDSRLPFKKRRIPLPPKNEIKEEISYPATPMISIAEVEALNTNKMGTNRLIKTAAERKEMPPLASQSAPYVNTEASPIITDQYHNHTYNNPTINYHMNNVPIPFINIPYAPCYPISPIIFPFNNVPSDLHNLDAKKSVNQKGTRRGMKREHHNYGRYKSSHT